MKILRKHPPSCLGHSPMYQGGVTFSDIEEEKCLKASHLTLTRITKGLVENEEGARRRKRKITIENPREPILTVEANDENENKERGGYEAYSEQPMLSPLAD